MALRCADGLCVAGAIVLTTLAGTTPLAPAADKPAVSPLGDSTQGDRSKVWVYFTDKGLSDPGQRVTALNTLTTTYPARAIDRRTMRRTAPGLFDERDLPVDADYAAAVEAVAGPLHVTSRWLNAVTVRTTRHQRDLLRSFPFVDRVEPVRGGRRTALATSESVATAAPSPPPGAGAFYGLSEPQLAQINLIALHDDGATGAGVLVGILDTGFKRDHVAFNHPDHPVEIVAEWDFINGDGNTGIDDGDPDSQHSHGTYILGTLGGYAPGAYVGGAYDASFILCKTEDTTSETPIEEDNYVAGMEFIEMHGGDIATSSLGYIDWYTQGDLDGLTAVTTIAVNIATENGLHCCTSGGNGGHDDDPATSHLLAPSDALQILAVGAVDADGFIAGFSSDGPTADGRAKPEVLARGVDTLTVTSMSDDEYFGANGTSLSAPLIAGALACIVQARPTWTVDELRSFLFASAEGAGAFDPMFVRGYGVIDAFGAVAMDCNANGVPDAIDLANGDSEDANGNALPDECECPADLDGSGGVDFPDLLAILAAWGPCDACPEDIDADGAVGFADLLTILSNWGPCA